MVKAVNSLVADHHDIEAIQLIFNNVTTIEENLDHHALSTIVELLLDHDEFNLSNSFFQAITTDSEVFQLSSFKFIFAKYHARRYEWSKVNTLLKNVTPELSAKNAAYASLLKGTALQRLKQHRLAQKSYKKIPENFIYYRHAQLNTAIAQIRQGWLTNAKKTITALTIQNNNSEDEFTNRLYLVLGYALLQKDYYRSARDIFRKVSQKSNYANRALLGIALCAINQNDYEGGLNTLSILKNKKTLDLSVDESYLLIAYIYEKLQQDIDVIASSTAAMSYYQDRIVNLQNIIHQYSDFTQLTYTTHPVVFTIKNQPLEYADKFPQSFLVSYRQLLNFSQYKNNSELNKKIKKLSSQYDQILQKIINQLVMQKINHLNSYINQTRYGLAQLYDNSSREVNK